MEELNPLFLRAQSGDRAAYGEVVRRFQDMAVGYAYAILGDFHLAEDAAQEAFIEAYPGLERLYSPFAFPAWLRRIIFKHCDRLTRGRRYQTVPMETTLELASAGPDPSEALEAREMKDRVHEAIQGLPEHERQVVILFYIAEHSQDEIAVFLGVPVTTVKKRLHDARKRLRERMMDMVQEILSGGAPSRNEGFTSKVLEGVQLFARGKVRDVYDLDDRLLIVATDRISAYDCVMPNSIPEKGKVLTAMSLFWFNLTRDIVQSHLITADVGKYPEALRRFADQLEGRSMLVRKAKRIDLECVVRGYLAGSGWKEYRATSTVCGIRLPPGLRESERLPETIFTPSTKADSGHDENISFEQAAELVGEALARRLREISIAIYQKARDYADGRGILIADTKFEFGLIDGEVILIDEILSPDSSRFWPKDRYEPGRPQDSFDKQFVRDYLDTLDWDKTPPAPALPDEIVRKTAEKYREAYQKLVTD